MQKQPISVCIRCGKQRVFQKTWQEYIGTSLITRTSSVCEDEACQKIVDEELAAEKAKRELHAERRLAAMQRRRK